MNGRSSTMPAASITRSVTAAKVIATLRHIHARWRARSPATASCTPRAVTSGQTSPSVKKPTPATGPPWASNDSDSPEAPPTRIAPRYSQPAVRCRRGQRRRTPPASCSGASTSASPAMKKCSGTSSPDTAKLAPNGSSLRKLP
jgi:hypothetical protein